MAESWLSVPVYLNMNEFSLNIASAYVKSMYFE